MKLVIFLLAIISTGISLNLPENENELNILFTEKSKKFSKINNELLIFEKERESLRNEFTKITNKNDWNIQKIIFLNNKIENLKLVRRDLNHEILIIENEIRNSKN